MEHTPSQPQSYLWGIDLGGTKIECAVLSSEGFDCVVRERIATERDKGYQHILQQIKRLVERCAKLVGHYPHSIGFGTPGTLDPITAVMKNCNSTVLNDQPLDRDLSQLLGVEVVIANDANCFALAETKMGIVPQVAPQAETVFGIIMGTGVGAGVVVNGKVLHGCHGIAGEWGHNVLEPDGVACYCGKKGCVETVLSGPGLEAYHARLTHHAFEPKPTSDGACEVHHLTLPEIVAQARAGTPAAKHTLTRLVNQFGLAVAPIINVLDPDVIVIGGGVGNIDELYQGAEAAILPHLFNPRLATKIVKPALGDSAGVFGAAMLVANHAGGE
ncbi:sugar kinase [Photobacterium jeanii]|uniref:Sugar kinase n=1 Tax=Photobacterium jeanii TaxID=858640 RepID=A0A178K2Y6_9GAMM|nr:ROK family protein [Photobacterium jeanii]OAN11082.1 sugar kinase [Photobacterium jeanii]PST90596.1 sugar kinase [Photobacterium jeanii]